MKQRTTFKENEIGIIPIEWNAKEFQEVGKVNMGQSPKSETYNIMGNGLPFYQGRRDFGRKYPTVSVYCTEELIPNFVPPQSFRYIDDFMKGGVLQFEV